MTYKWAKEYALALIGQYTMAGTEVPDSYNNQADYVKRIPTLMDSAQLHVATTSGRIRTTAPLSTLSCDETGEWHIYTMPHNFWQLCSGGLIRADGPRLQRFHCYHLLDRNHLAVHRGVDGEMLVEYYRYPRPLGSEPEEDALLDNSVEAQMALPYYVAAHLVMQDNAFAYASLYNEFETRLARLAEQPQTELNVVEDAYSPAEWRYDT